MATHSSILAWRIPMDRGDWWAVVYGVVKSWTWLSVHSKNKTREVSKYFELNGSENTACQNLWVVQNQCLEEFSRLSFIRQLDWVWGCPDMWSNSVLDVSVKASV